MKGNQTPRKRRVAIALDLSWGFRRHIEAFAGCHAYAENAGWECFIHPAPERMLAQKGSPAFDGIIARATQEMAKGAKEAGVPIVNIWMNSPTTGLPCVFPDLEMTGVMAAEHLLSRGFRSFGFLGLEDDACSVKQWQGFSAVANEAEFECSSHLFPNGAVDGEATEWESFISRLDSWIGTWKLPIGIFVTQDLYCRYLLDLCHARGIYVSQGVAIVGCGNEAIICDAPLPSLTSVDTGYSRLGHRAAQLLDDLMAGGEPPNEPILVTPAELIPRQSTDVFATNDPMVSRALRFIAENSHERIEVKEVVSAVATNRRSLERRFRSSIGKSIAEEITRLRLERAKRRIVETDAPMKHVAVESGFRNADHFYKVFTRVEGITPSQFREERQKVFLEV